MGMYKRRRPPHAFTPGQMLLILRQEPQMVALLQHNAIWLAVTPRTAWILDHCCSGQLEGGPETAKEVAAALGLVLPEPEAELKGFKVPELPAEVPMETDLPAPSSATADQGHQAEVMCSDPTAAPAPQQTPMAVDDSASVDVEQQQPQQQPQQRQQAGGGRGRVSRQRSGGASKDAAIPWALQSHCWMCVRFTLEEAFFLQHVLGVLVVQKSEADGGQPRALSDQELWSACTAIRPNFPTSYIGYHHLKCKGWLPRSGMLYGVDFVAYAMHPAAAHSHFSILIVPLHEGIPPPSPPPDSALHALTTAAASGGAGGAAVAGSAAAGCESAAQGLVAPPGAYAMEWHDLQITTRVVNTVAKKLILLYIHELPTSPGRHTPDCISHFAVEERIVRRWVPDASRD